MSNLVKSSCYTTFDASQDSRGVHWIWWLLIALIPGPLLLLVGYIHHARLSRAIVFYRKKYLGDYNE